MDKILDPQTKIIAVEAASALEWYKFADEIYSMKSFGESGKAGALFEYFGFTPEKIAEFASKHEQPNTTYLKRLFDEMNKLKPDSDKSLEF